MKNFYLILIAVVLIGFSVFFRKLSVDRINPYYIQILAGGIYFCCIPLWLFLLRKEDATYTAQGLGFAVICIVLSMIASIMIGFILKKSTHMGVTSALISLNPIITLILSFLFLNEVFTIWKLIALFLALASAILVNF